MNIIEDKLTNIEEICRRYYVDGLAVFGSVLTDRFSTSSDVDFVVIFKNVSIDKYADNYFLMHNELEHLLNRNVDLLEYEAIRNPILRNNIDSTKKVIYGRI